MSTFHIVLSIQWTTDNGITASFTHEATVSVQDDTTRQHVFREVRAATEHAVGIRRNSSTILFFDCRPDELGGGQS